MGTGSTIHPDEESRCIVDPTVEEEMMMNNWPAPVVAVLALCAILLWANLPVVAQTQDVLAVESSFEDAPKIPKIRSNEWSLEVRRIAQPAFAWAVGPWRDSETIRTQAEPFRNGGYLVRIVPDDSLSEFRLAIGHYLSEEDARNEEAILPMPVREESEVIAIDKHVVFLPQVNAQQGERNAGADSEKSEPQYPPVEESVGTSGGGGTQTTGPPTANRPSRSWQIPGTMLRPFEIRFATSIVYDSNINHDQEDLVGSVGFVPGLMLRYRSALRNPILVITYGVARHRYTQTDRWNRVSHMLTTRFHPFRGRFRPETGIDLAKNGSFEDRDVSDQIQVFQAFEYRVTRDLRLHTYGTLRWKYPKFNDDDAFKPNVGMIVEQKLDGDRTWEMGARYEVNLEEIERGNYSRWTFEMDYEIPLSERTELKLGIKHRRKNYWNRDVEIEDDDYPRRDQRWLLGSSINFFVSRNVVTNLRYQFEARSSNDPRKPFSSHLLDFSFFVMF